MRAWLFTLGVFLTLAGLTMAQPPKGYEQAENLDSFFAPEIPNYRRVMDRALRVDPYPFYEEKGQDQEGNPFHKELFLYWMKHAPTDVPHYLTAYGYISNPQTRKISTLFPDVRFPLPTGDIILPLFGELYKMTKNRGTWDTYPFEKVSGTDAVAGISFLKDSYAIPYYQPKPDEKNLWHVGTLALACADGKSFMRLTFFELAPEPAADGTPVATLGVFTTHPRGDQLASSYTTVERKHVSTGQRLKLGGRDLQIRAVVPEDKTRGISGWVEIYVEPLEMK